MTDFRSCSFFIIHLVTYLLIILPILVTKYNQILHQDITKIKGITIECFNAVIMYALVATVYLYRAIATSILISIQIVT